ncbi:hypothetical protein RFI_03609 [Reticulomyxa filosa]|uniref:Uncharacterized protein n=1 Tax=Reticulomyxa filosa TaxID=46433 RepID=X6P5U4_RETFI|nr:hypothetical protein RFI_03609 [Reticulomyxa filosa]|eukprot:ETO33493.1 hypothetical protein RFI_03609 [Reticulomyxa filosa]
MRMCLIWESKVIAHIHQHLKPSRSTYSSTDAIEQLLVQPYGKQVQWQVSCWYVRDLIESRVIRMPKASFIDGLFDHSFFSNVFTSQQLALVHSKDESVEPLQKVTRRLVELLQNSHSSDTCLSYLFELSTVDLHTCRFVVNTLALYFVTFKSFQAQWHFIQHKLIPLFIQYLPYLSPQESELVIELLLVNLCQPIQYPIRLDLDNVRTGHCLTFDRCFMIGTVIFRTLDKLLWTCAPSVFDYVSIHLLSSLKVCICFILKIANALADADMKTSKQQNTKIDADWPVVDDKLTLHYWILQSLCLLLSKIKDLNFHTNQCFLFLCDVLKETLQNCKKTLDTFDLFHSIANDVRHAADANALKMKLRSRLKLLFKKYSINDSANSNANVSADINAITRKNNPTQIIFTDEMIQEVKKKVSHKRNAVVDEIHNIHTMIALEFKQLPTQFQSLLDQILRQSRVT